jgi:hypothetical protein
VLTGWSSAGFVDFTVRVPAPGARRFWLKYSQPAAPVGYRAIEVDGAEVSASQAFATTGTDSDVYGLVGLSHNFATAGVHHIRLVYDASRGSAERLDLDMLSVETLETDPYTNPQTW